MPCSRVLGLFVATLALSAGCQRAPSGGAATPTAAVPTPAAASVNLDVPPGRVRIGGEERGVLPRNQQSHELPIGPEAVRSRLSIALGLTPLEGEGGVVRLDVSLRGRGVPDRLLQRFETGEVGWHDMLVEIDADGLVDPRVVINRELVSGSIGRLLRSAVATPALIPRRAADAPLSVLLVSIDTLRADRVGVYGDDVVRTPVLDRLANSGVMFTDAYSPAMWTLPSHASLFYGAHLPDTPAGLRAQQRDAAALDIPEQPLAELLRQHGWTTAGFTGGGFLGLPFDFRRGFDVYYEFAQPTHVADACPPDRFDGGEVFRRADNWLRANGDRPFFLFVHTYDVHDRCPFLPPGAGDGFGTWPELDAATYTKLDAHYRALIAETDGRLGALLQTLRDVEADGHTIVIVTSDHGEGLDEHDQRGHSCQLRAYEELVRVPLLVRDPRRPGPRRVKTPVSLIDLAPTVLALLDLAPPPWMRGHVLPGLGLAHPDPPPPVVVLCDRQMALRDGRDKLIATYGAAESDELYDLAADPLERRNRAAAEPVALDTLRALAERAWQPSQFKAAPDAKPVDETTLDPAARERLRALGYVQ
ncbi:sulfatase [bacterium]|nr:sulfatase [bacterium]